MEKADQQDQKKIKILILGDSESGKLELSKLLSKKSNQVHNEKHMPTLGIDFVQFNYNYNG